MKAEGVRIESQSAAVPSDSVLALNRTRRWPDMDTTEAKMARIKEVSQHKTRERLNAKSAHIAELWFLRDGILSAYESVCPMR